MLDDVQILYPHFLKVRIPHYKGFVYSGILTVAITAPAEIGHQINTQPTVPTHV